MKAIVKVPRMLRLIYLFTEDSLKMLWRWRAFIFKVSPHTQTFVFDIRRVPMLLKNRFYFIEATLYTNHGGERGTKSIREVMMNHMHLRTWWWCPRWWDQCHECCGGLIHRDVEANTTTQRIGMKLMYSVEYNKHIPSIPVELKATYKLVKLCPLSNGANWTCHNRPAIEA